MSEQPQNQPNQKSLDEYINDPQFSIQDSHGNVLKDTVIAEDLKNLILRFQENDEDTEELSNFLGNTSIGSLIEMDDARYVSDPQNWRLFFRHLKRLYKQKRPKSTDEVYKLIAQAIFLSKTDLLEIPEEGDE